MGALPIHLFRRFCCRMYRLATMRGLTDRGTDDTMMPIADHTVRSKSECRLLAIKIHRVNQVLPRLYFWLAF